MKKLNPIFTVLVIAFLLAFFQIGQVSQKLNHYGIDNNLTSIFPWGNYLQQKVEELKISLKGSSIKNINKENSFVEPIEANNLKEPIVTEIKGQNVILQNNTDKLNQLNVENIVPILKKRCTHNCLILTIGDSVMGDVYYSLNRQLKKYHPDWKIVNAHKVSSGLSNAIYYNWPKVTDKLLKEIKPDYIVILIGMNDAQDITDEKNQSVKFNTPQWSNAYKQRVQTMHEMMLDKSFPVWIALPNVKAGSFEKRLNKVREIHQQVNGSNYVEVKHIIGDSTDNKFNQFRQSDGIHLNALGADKIAEHVYTHVLK